MPKSSGKRSRKGQILRESKKKDSAVPPEDLTPKRGGAVAKAGGSVAMKASAENVPEKKYSHNADHSDSDFESPSKQLKPSKSENASFLSSSSDSEFEEVDTVKPSTSKTGMDFAELDQKNLDIATLAKIEGVQLDKRASSEESEDDSDWEKVEGQHIFGLSLNFFHLCCCFSAVL